MREDLELHLGDRLIQCSRWNGNFAHHSHQISYQGFFKDRRLGKVFNGDNLNSK